MYFLLPFIFVCCLAVVKADTILLANGETLSGNEVQFNAEGNLVIDGKHYDSSTIAQWLTSNAPTVGARHGIRFRDGRYYLGTLTSADAQSISLRAEPLGLLMAIPREDIAEIHFLRRDFKANRSNINRESPFGTLHRPGVAPVPCQLDGIGAGQIAVSTKIGRFFLPMDTLGSYTMSSQEEVRQPPSASWEVGLTDGSVFHGKLTTSGNQFTLQTSGQLAISLPLKAIRYARNPNAANWVPLWKAGKSLQDGLGQSEIPKWARGILITVGEAITLPASASGELQLQANLAHHDQGRIIVTRDGNELSSLEISNSPKTVTLPIPKGSHLTFRIESNETNASAVLSDIVIIGKGTR